MQPTTPSMNSALDKLTPTLISNSQSIEKVQISQIKIPARPIKPPSPAAITHCKRNLDHFGQPLPVLIADDGTVIFGFEFLVAAKELGWTHINAIRFSGLSDTGKRILTLALAKVPLLSDWDYSALHAEQAEIIDSDFDLIDLTGFSMGKIDVILDPELSAEPANALDNQPDAPEPDEVVSRPGDLFQLGEHRILCGDALVPESLSLLLAGDAARAVITDPPYNIKIANNASGLGKKKHGDFAMASGEMSIEQFSAFLTKFLASCTSTLVTGGLIYLFMDRRHLEQLFRAAREVGLHLVDLCIWNKQSGGMGSFYRSQHEPCGVFRWGDTSHSNNIQLGRHGRYRTNVWDHRGLSSFGKNRAESLAAHPTVKPVNLLADIIKDCTRRGDVVLDPFLGSGSTILAAEKTGRRCFGIELEPRYVDVAIRRWEAITGKSAIHVGSGLTFTNFLENRAVPTGQPPASPSPTMVDDNAR